MPTVGLLETKLMIILLYTLLPVAAGAIAGAALITAKVPNAKEVLSKLLPFKAFIGVASLFIGFWHLIGVFMTEGATGAWFDGIFGLSYFIVTIGLILVGFILGMPLIAQWIPGDSAPETKALEMQKKLVKFEVPIGITTAIGGLLVLLTVLEVIKP